MSSIRYAIRVTGLVQGVGFRYSARREALALGLTGTVRNQSDGSVSIEAEGSQADLDRFANWCRGGPRGARVDHLETCPIPTRGDSGFVILP